MKSDTRFSIAVHVLTLVGTECGVDATSEFIAGSVGVNPVTIRNIASMLRKAGLVSTSQGKAGIVLERNLDNISLLEVLRAVEDDVDIFGLHQNPNPACPVGRHIQHALDEVYQRAQQAMYTQLSNTKVSDILDGIYSML